MHTDPAGQAVLAAAHIKQFVSVADADYNPIRDMARVANETEAWLCTAPLARTT